MIQAELEPQFSLAMQAYLSGKLTEADTYFAQITSRWPQCIEAWFQRGEIAEQQQNFSAAIGHYEKVLAQNPEVQEVWFRLGSIAAHQQMPQLAIAYWTQAININPTYAEPQLHLGLLYARSENPLAHPHLTQVCVLNQSALPLILLARTLLWQNQHGVSAQIIATALDYLKTQTAVQTETDPLYHQALALAIQIAHEQQQDAQAIEHVKTASLTTEHRASLAALYLPLSASEDMIQDFRKNHPQASLSTLPIELVPQLLAWDKHQVQSLVYQQLYPQRFHTPLSAQTSPPKTKPPFRLVCVIHESTMPLWSTYLAHLKTLPRQYWELHLLVLHTLPVPLDTLKASLHRMAPENAMTWLSQQDMTLLLHTGVDRQAEALALAFQCRPFPIPNLKWTPYSHNAFVYENVDPCFSGEFPCEALLDSPQDALHLQRWSVLLQHHLRTSYSSP